MIRLVARRGLSPAVALLAASLAACSNGTSSGLSGSSWMPYVSWPGGTAEPTLPVAAVPPPAPIPGAPVPMPVPKVPATPPPQKPAHVDAYMVSLQRALNTHGAKLRVDGRCGTATRNAIQEYEMRLGVAALNSHTCQVSGAVWQGLHLSVGHRQ